jgi:hypothetical protein
MTQENRHEKTQTTTTATTHGVSRRGLLRTAGGLAAAGAAGAGGVLASLTAGGASAAPATFTHPGGLHNAGDINRARVRVAEGTDPWLAGWNRLTANPHSASTWAPNPLPEVYRGEGWEQNYPTLYNDVAAAYQNALRYHVSGDAAHGDCAVNILNAWSSTLTLLNGSAAQLSARWPVVPGVVLEVVSEVVPQAFVGRGIPGL